MHLTCLSFDRFCGFSSFMPLSALVLFLFLCTPHPNQHPSSPSQQTAQQTPATTALLSSSSENDREASKATELEKEAFSLRGTVKHLEEKLRGRGRSLAEANRWGTAAAKEEASLKERLRQAREEGAEKARFVVVSLPLFLLSLFLLCLRLSCSWWWW